ncbi:hypothetical protein ACH5RR_009092 [Cinchona calisaya]|uniref:Receptor-like serine/threonine-protein kinase n=1 Tax=Cinchona calisaya TaxID=153742 RepID=A0ABD3AH14_9GENT
MFLPWLNLKDFGVEIKLCYSGNSNIFCGYGWFSSLSVVLLLLLSSAFSGLCDDFTMVSVPLGFEINGMDRSKNWVSENGVFAFGFLEKYGDDDLDSYVVGIRYNLGNVTVNMPVWTVGGGVRVSMNSTIRLDMDGRLVLIQNSNGIVWSTNTSTLGVEKASLLDNGNLVLLDRKDKVLWESFGSPTNTLLPSQSLHYPQNLRALSTKSTLSYYSLVIGKSGELALVWEHNVTYWRSEISSSVIAEGARFDSNGVLGLYDDSNKVAWSVSSKDFGDSSVTLRHLSIDKDGNLRIYSWDNITHEWRVGWQAVDKQCDVFGSCGLYSVCGYNTTGSVCDCLYSQSSERGTASAAVDSSGSGCQKMVDLGNCRMHTSIVVMKQTVLYGLYPPNDVKIFLSQNDCKNYCLNDTTCIAATSMNDGSRLCTVKRTSFISGYNTPSIPATSFLKVCSVPQAVAAQGVNPRDSAGLIYSSIGRHKAGGGNIRVFIGAIALIVFITMLVVLSMEMFVFWLMHRRGQIKAQTRIPFGKDAQMNPHYSALIRLSFDEIKELTENFATPLGPSHFKGTLPNKTVVVAKMLNDVVLPEKEFRVAVSTLGGTHHRNLVSLKGFCFEPKHKILLYEYVENGSLDQWLFSNEQDETKKIWEHRLHIAVGVARAIAYLHTECQQCIIHGNLKLENILLDENYVPKVTDFGLRTLLLKEAASSSETPSEKDIYMLGQLLLQVVTCKRDVIGKNLQNMLDELSQDQKFVDSSDLKAVERVVKIAIWCMQNQPYLRPAISEVVKVLEGTLSVDRPPSGFVYRHDGITDGEVATDIMEGEES